jgi:hypothetical protein
MLRAGRHIGEQLSPLTIAQNLSASNGTRHTQTQEWFNAQRVNTSLSASS